MFEHTPRTRAEAAEADRADPVAPYRDHFLVDPAGPVYLDGNSLGRQPRAAAAAVSTLLAEWARDLVGGWERWADLPGTVGDRVGLLVGAAPGRVVVSDSTTVNLYKLAVAAIDGTPRGRRRSLVTPMTSPPCATCSKASPPGTAAGCGSSTATPPSPSARPVGGRPIGRRRRPRVPLSSQLPVGCRRGHGRAQPPALTRPVP